MLWKNRETESYITGTEAAQLSILFRVSARLTASSLRGQSCHMFTWANPNLHTHSVIPSTASSHCRTSGATFIFLRSAALQLLSLKQKQQQSLRGQSWFRSRSDSYIISVILDYKKGNNGKMSKLYIFLRKLSFMQKFCHINFSSGREKQSRYE